MKCQCESCAYKADYKSLPPAKDLFERVHIGGIFSDVECPKCGALCFPIKEKKANKTPIPQRKLTLAYPVRVELFYEDYEPFGDKDSRSYSQIYFYQSNEEALQAKKAFKDAAEKLDILEYFDAFTEYPEGVAYGGRFHRLRDTQDLLAEQISEKEASI